jgi:hypothetical protein
VGGHGRPLPARRARHPPAHPDPLRHRHRARRRQHGRRDGLPAQHRPRRHARPGPRARHRARRRGGDADHRAAMGLRAVHLRGARRPLGPHVRVLRRGSGARRADGDGHRRLPGRPGAPQGPRPRPRHGQALRGRRPHHVRHRVQHGDDGQLPDRPGRRPGRSRDVRPPRAVALRARGRPAPRRQRDTPTSTSPRTASATGSTRTRTAT